MVKFRFLFTVLFFAAVFAVFPQDGSERSDPSNRRRPGPPSADSGKLSFSVLNETGFPVRAVFVCKSDNEDWGENILASPLLDKERVSVSIDFFERGITYNIRVQDVDGDFYSKYNVGLRERSVVKMEMTDLEFER